MIFSKTEYLKKVEELIEHDRLYYEECKPIISDYEYDLLVKEVEAFERVHPHLVVSYSPTRRVGEKPSKGFLQGKHQVPMLSLANTYSKEELEDFVKRVYKLLRREDLCFCVELKMDGTAISLRYEKGNFVRALTRGDGWIGDDITMNVKTIKTLPLKLRSSCLPDLLEIRAEAFMHKNTFRELNEEREENGLEPWANPRNAAAGSLKLLDPREVAARKLDLITYWIAEGKVSIKSQFDLLKYLKSLGLPISKEGHFARCSSIDEILAFAEKIHELRPKLSFEIDGIVVKVDDLTTYEELGTTGKSPRYAVAYKFASKQAYTRIREITIQVGRTGILTPVAELEPVHLAGSTISRATLHNQEEIARKDIRVGDFVVIEKGGDVIPKVVKVDLDKREKKSSTWHMPRHCPSCHSSVIHVKGEVAIRCPNNECPERNIRRIAFFASKHALDIEHMGEKVVRQLVAKGLVMTPSDIFLLDEKKLATLEGFKEKSIANLLESIERSKQCSLARFLLALEIKYVGSETAELLAEKVGEVDRLFTITKEELLEVEGIGEKVASSIVEYFQDPTNQKEIALLFKGGLTPRQEAKIKKMGHNFLHKVFVLTGTLEHYSREEAAKLIKERGGKVSSSVSKNIDFVLVGEGPGSKYEKAKKLGLSLLSEEEFTKML